MSRTSAPAPAASAQSESSWLGSIGGFFNEVGNAFSKGFTNVRNGDFRQMDWKQWLAMGATAYVGVMVAKAVFEMLWEFVQENKFVVMLVGIALAAIALFSLMGGSKGRTAEAEPRPDPAARRRGGPRGTETGSLDESLTGDGIPGEVKRVAMSQVGSTQVALLDPDVMQTLNLDAVRLADDLPKARSQETVAAEARKQLALLG